MRDPKDGDEVGSRDGLEDEPDYEPEDELEDEELRGREPEEKKPEEETLEEGGARTKSPRTRTSSIRRNSKLQQHKQALVDLARADSSVSPRWPRGLVTRGLRPCHLPISEQSARGRKDAAIFGLKRLFSSLHSLIDELQPRSFVLT